MTMRNLIVVVRGGGDLGSGVAHKLQRCGFRVLVVEVEAPTVIRRSVAFAQAVFEGQVVVEGVAAVRADGPGEVTGLWDCGNIPVLVDPACAVLQEIQAEVLVDATLSKKNTGMRRNLAPLTIALGPGFEAGVDVDVVVETDRGHNLGRLIFDGYAEPNTGIPASVKGMTSERVLRAPGDGVTAALRQIGDQVIRGETVCTVAGRAVKAGIDGMLRGLIMSEVRVAKGAKIGDIDPRAVREHCFTISDKARALGGAVLEAILHWQYKNQPASRDDFYI